MSTIKLKRSATPSKVPTTASLELGEVAINTYDGKLYIKKSVDGVESIVEVGAFGQEGEIVSNVKDTRTFVYAVSDASSVSGNDDNNALLSYTVGRVDVFYNGVKLLKDVDYTATSGSSVSFTESMTGVIEVVAYSRVAFMLTGSSITAIESSIGVDTFTGNGSNTQYTLSKEPLNDQFAFVTINGVQQHVSEYSVANNTLVFSEAPANNDVIEVRTIDYYTATGVHHDHKKFIFTANSANTFTGADDIGATLDYVVDLVDVYVNGVKLVDGYDYTASDGETITLAENVTGTVEIISLAASSFISYVDSLTANSVALSTNTASQVVDTFSATNYRSAKYIVQMTQGTDYHVSEVLVLHDGTSTYMTEYGTMYTNASLGTISSDVANGYVRVLVSPTSANTDINTQRITVVTA